MIVKLVHKPTQSCAKLKESLVFLYKRLVAQQKLPVWFSYSRMEQCMSSTKFCFPLAENNQGRLERNWPRIIFDAGTRTLLKMISKWPWGASVERNKSHFEQRHRNKNGYDQKNEPTILLPSEVHTKTKPKTNPNPKLSLFFRFRVFG